MQLIIVESPTKSKTLQGFLDKTYKVLSSYGHVRDLPKNELGIDIEKAVYDKIEMNENKYPVDLSKDNATKYNRRWPSFA